MSSEQKAIDFQQLASLFAKRYSFVEWKLDALRYDALDLRPWLDRIAKTQTDLEYFEICAEYTAKFQDAHTGFEVPSEYVATLGFSTDLYDGKVVIDSIDRKRLPETEFPFKIGDELVSIDGRPVSVLLEDFGRFVGHGNVRSARRVTAWMLTTRPQAYIPKAHEIGDTAQVVISGRDGTTATYTINWQKSGMVYFGAGPVPTPQTGVRQPRQSNAARRTPNDAAWPRSLDRIRTQQVMRSRLDRASVGIGALTPVFALPPEFTQRLGTDEYDSFFSGILKFQDLTLGFIRVGSFEYLYTSDLQREIKYMEQNTDGLIIDVMRNPGGYGCTAENLVRHLAPPNGIRSVGNSVRATWDFILGLQYDIELAREYEEGEEVIAELERQLEAAKAAFSRNRGMTEPLPVCGTSMDLPPATDRDGKQVTYSKPVMVLVDDRSTSAAEMFAAIMQDSKRALIYGYRTAGAGGSVSSYRAGTYSETAASLAISIMIRKDRINTSEYPAMPYVENIGVRPDKTDDYMTTENLLNKGAGFVSNFLSTMAEYVKANRTN